MHLRSATLVLLTCIFAAQAIPIAPNSHESGANHLPTKRAPGKPSQQSKSVASNTQHPTAASTCKKGPKKLQKRSQGERSCCLSRFTSLTKYLVVEICKVKHGGQDIDIKGEKLTTHDSKNEGIYMITEAPGLGKGEFFAKKGITATELHMSQKMGLVIAQSEDGTCIVMKKIGQDVRELPGYAEAHRGGVKTCDVWAEAKATLAHNAVMEMRKKEGLQNWSHGDVKPANTRWLSATEVVLIDFGMAKEHTPAIDTKKDPDDLANMKWIWTGDLCGKIIGKTKGMEPPATTQLRSTVINEDC
ncbi:hypothetical protein FS842_004802 [Serendipita sp. 407]|nr:hypothetical protein FS842_004802 [Serendipita sp. 407]